MVSDVNLHPYTSDAVSKQQQQQQQPKNLDHIGGIGCLQPPPPLVGLGDLVGRDPGIPGRPPRSSSSSWEGQLGEGHHHGRDDYHHHHHHYRRGGVKKEELEEPWADISTVAHGLGDDNPGRVGAHAGAGQLVGSGPADDPEVEPGRAS